MLRSETEYPLAGPDLFGGLYQAWTQGWLDEFSDEHFLIKAIEKRLENYPRLFQVPPYLMPLYQITPSNFQENFCINFSAKITRLITLFGEDNIRRFFMDQLSAGKTHYDSDQFFRALSEISILSFLAMNATSGVYEPKTNLAKNPEARLCMKNGVAVDVEVKTPGFSEYNEIENLVIPTVLLTDQGRMDFMDFCKSHSLNGKMPRVMKIKDFLNSAAEKFEVVDHVHRMNLLYINWSLSEFGDSGFQEAFSLMANEINGILVHRNIGVSLGIHEEVYNKVTAVIVYTESLQGLMFGDFRWVWIRGQDRQPRFGIIGLNNCEGLFEVTGMNPYGKQLTPLITGIFHDMSCAGELMELIAKNMLGRQGDVCT